MQRLRGSDQHTQSGERATARDAYKRLAGVFHAVLSEESPDVLLERIGAALAELVPHDALSVTGRATNSRLLPMWRHEPVERTRCPTGAHPPAGSPTLGRTSPDAATGASLARPPGAVGAVGPGHGRKSAMLAWRRRMDPAPAS